MKNALSTIHYQFHVWPCFLLVFCAQKMYFLDNLKELIEKESKDLPKEKEEKKDNEIEKNQNEEEVKDYKEKETKEENKDNKNKENVKDKEEKDKNKEKLALSFSGQEFSPSLAATPAMMSSVSIGRSKEGRIDETWGRRRGQRES